MKFFQRKKKVKAPSTYKGTWVFHIIAVLGNLSRMGDKVSDITTDIT
jgi:hypothetical protein